MQSLPTHLRLASAAALLIAASLTQAHAASAYGVDGMSLEGGTGNSSQFARVGAQWDWNKAWWQSNGTHINGYWDLSLSEFRMNRYQNRAQSKNLTDVGFTPVFRFEADSKKGLYAEGGVGLNLMSHLYDNAGRRFSTAFEFGDHIGAGYVFSNGLDLGIRLQHFSNGGIKEPNSGANFAVLRVAYRF
jgi:lipid A 3-O-deacylase